MMYGLSCATATTLRRTATITNAAAVKSRTTFVDFITCLLSKDRSRRGRTLLQRPCLAIVDVFRDQSGQNVDQCPRTGAKNGSSSWTAVPKSVVDSQMSPHRVSSSTVNIRGRVRRSSVGSLRRAGLQDLRPLQGPRPLGVQGSQPALRQHSRAGCKSLRLESVRPEWTRKEMWNA